jgi:uncharacterized repeat protein (TIGR01451 family)
VWSVASIASGVSRDLVIVARVDAQGLITNAAEVTASGTLDPTSAPNDGGGDDFATVDITGQPPAADLSLTMGVSNAAPAVGASVTYTLTVTNAGPSATGGVSVIDLLPAGVTFQSASASQGSYDAGSGAWTVGALGASASATLDILVRVDQAGVIDNAAEVAAANVVDPDSTPANGSTTEDDNAAATITAQAVAPPPPPPPATADLEIVKSTSTTTATVGDTLTYAIVVTNEGPGTATNVAVLDQLPAGLQYRSATATAGSYDPNAGLWTIPSITAGTSASLTITTRVLTAGNVANTAQITSSDQPDPDGTSPSTATITVTGPPPTPTRLSIKKTTRTATVKAGGTVVFTIVVRNIGTVPATNVVLTDCIPSGLSLIGGRTNAKLTKGRLGWRLGTLQPGQTRTVRTRFRVDRDARGMRGCSAVAAGANTGAVTDRARVRIVAGTSTPARAPVTG